MTVLNLKKNNSPERKRELQLFNERKWHPDLLERGGYMFFEILTSRDEHFLYAFWEFLLY